MPMAAMSDSLRRIQLQDLQNWTLFWKAVMKQSGMDAIKVDEAMQVNWPDKFPIRSIVALRVGLLEPATTDCICKYICGHKKCIGRHAISQLTKRKNTL